MNICSKTYKRYNNKIYNLIRQQMRDHLSSGLIYVYYVCYMLTLHVSCLNVLTCLDVRVNTC